MKRFVWVLLCASVLSAPARAEQDPVPGRADARMRYLAYNPGQVVHLSTAVGATLVVGFGAKETVTAVAVTNSKDLKAMPNPYLTPTKINPVLSTHYASSADRVALHSRHMGFKP